MKTPLRVIITLLFGLFLPLWVCAEGTQQVTVSLSGGTGKARLASPADATADEDGWTVTLHWSSPFYAFMLIDGVRYEPTCTENGSVFEIPIPSLTCTLAVQANTVAMSTPHLIDYILTFGAAEETPPTAQAVLPSAAAAFDPPGDALPLRYADGFRLTALADGIWLITIADTDRYLLLPEGACTPENLPEDVVILRQPLNRIYLSASGVMDMFISCGALDTLAFSSLKENDWQLAEAKAAMQAGRLQYAGKYSAPDYELLYAGGCDLAIENRMITHAPKVAEELTQLGIPVLIDRSSDEATPQGRMEWIKLYGLLTGRYAEAEAFFDKQAALMERSAAAGTTGPKVAFFYVTSSGLASVRSADDYIPHLIESSGGRYAFSQYGQKASGSSTLIQLEDFCAEACDADYLVYNSTITGELKTMRDFLALCPLFAGMKAVREGHVFCTTRNMYQSSMQMGVLMNDLRVMLSGGDDFRFLYPLQ